MVDSKPYTTIIHNLNLTLPTGSHCPLIRLNGLGKSPIPKILGGRHLTPPDSYVRVPGLNKFCDTNINFHRDYLDTDWDTSTVAFTGVGIPLMEDIPVYGMMGMLQCSYSGRHDELVEILDIDINCIINQLSESQRIQTCADSDWSDNTIQGASGR